MRLSRKRARFSSLISKLVIWINDNSDKYAVYDDIKARDGHMRNSLHYDGTAGDVLLYDHQWNYLTETEDYRFAGEYWESLDSHCFWGGHTRRDEEGTDLSKDGNHFSMSWDNRR